MTTHHDIQKGTVMTVHTAHPGHHRISSRTAGIALAGALLAVGAGYGVASLVLDEAPASIIEPEKTRLRRQSRRQALAGPGHQPRGARPDAPELRAGPPAGAPLCGGAPVSASQRSKWRARAKAKSP